MELAVAGVVTLVVLGGLLQAFISIWSANTFSMNQMNAQQYAKQMAMSIADGLRHSNPCTSQDSGCTVGACVENASSSSITAYGRQPLTGPINKTQFTVSGGAYQITVNGGTAQTVVASTSSSSASLTLTYYKCDGTSYTGYHENGFVSYTPTSSTTSELIAVDIAASVTQGTVTAKYSTTVRLRNSPTGSYN